MGILGFFMLFGYKALTHSLPPPPPPSTIFLLEKEEKNNDQRGKIRLQAHN